MVSYEANLPYQLGCIKDSNRQLIGYPNLIFDHRNNKGRLVLNQGAKFSLTTEKYGEPVFLAELSGCQPLQLEHVMESWQYRQKNFAQEVLPFLFIGPMAAARDSHFIQSNNITMLVAVRDGKAASVNPRIMNPAQFASAHEIETSTFDVFDEIDTIHRFHVVVKQMNDHLRQRTLIRPVRRLEDIGGKILVFCEAGDRRSAATVILYFMAVFGLKRDDAIQAVRARRLGVNVTGDMMRTLQNCEEILQAERQIMTNPTSRCLSYTTTMSCGLKRTRDEVDDEDVDMDLYEDEIDTARVGTPPFKDAQI